MNFAGVVHVAAPGLSTSAARISRKSFRPRNSPQSHFARGIGAIYFVTRKLFDRNTVCGSSFSISVAISVLRALYLSQVPFILLSHRQEPSSIWSRGVCALRCWGWRSLCRANRAHIRQSRPDNGLGFQVKVLQFFFALKFSH